MRKAVKDARTETVDSEGSHASAEVELLPSGTIVASRYEILRPLGRGGYAAVYLAFDRELSAEIAVKVLRRDRSSPSAIARRFGSAATTSRNWSPSSSPASPNGIANGSVG
jgi:hypothetical protein